MMWEGMFELERHEAKSCSKNTGVVTIRIDLQTAFEKEAIDCVMELTTVLHVASLAATYVVRLLHVQKKGLLRRLCSSASTDRRTRQVFREAHLVW